MTRLIATRGIFRGLWCSLLIAVLIAFIVDRSNGGAPQANARNRSEGQASSTAPNRSGPPAGGNHEGIKVHGHWLIVVKNPDGKIAARREFENSFDQLASQGLAQILAGTSTVGGWDVVACQTLANIAVPAQNNCITQPTYGVVALQLSEFGSYPLEQITSSCIIACSNATIASMPAPYVSASGYGALVMGGTITQAPSMTIDSVGTFVHSTIVPGQGTGPGIALSTIAPSDALGSVPSMSVNNFTGTYLNSSIPITAGQSVMITVTISFQ